MVFVPKLISFFEGLSGTSHQAQKNIRLPDKYGIKTDNRSNTANTANIMGVSAVIGTFGNWFKCDKKPSNNLVSNVVDNKTDVQELEHQSEENIDCKEKICSERSEKKTTLRTNNGLHVDDARAIVSRGTNKSQGQFLGSNKNIAFLVGDETSDIKEGGKFHTKICDQDHTKEKNVQKDHLQDTNLSRFSLLEGRSLKESTGNFENSELDHNIKQTAMSYPVTKSTTTSRTSGIYSGSEYTQNNMESKGTKREQETDHRTKYFVEQTWTRQQQMPRMKYPSGTYVYFYF